MSSDRAEALREAMEDRTLVRFARRFESTTVTGYVMDVGPVFFLLALVSDRLWLDGYEAFRVADVSDIQPAPFADFVEAALEKRGEQLGPAPAVSVASIGELLRTAGRTFPLVTLHLEAFDDGVCWVGRVMEVSATEVVLTEIGPDAIWDEETERHRLDQITRVTFGGDYEDALALVAEVPDAPVLH